MSVLKGNKENTISGKQKDSVHREMLAVSANMRGKQHSRPSLAPRPQTLTDGKSSLKGNLSEVGVLLEKDPEDRVEITSVETVRVRHVFFWHPSECQHYKTQPGCKFGDKCVFRHSEVDSPPKSKSILRNGTKSLGTEAQRAILKKVHYATSKFGKERLHPKMLCSVLILTSASPNAPKILGRSEEETLKLE